MIGTKEGLGTYGQNFGSCGCYGGLFSCKKCLKKSPIKIPRTESKEKTEIEKDLTELFTKFPFVISATRRKDSNGLKNVDELVKAVMRIVR